VTCADGELAASNKLSMFASKIREGWSGHGLSPAEDGGGKCTYQGAPICKCSDFPSVCATSGYNSTNHV